MSERPAWRLPRAILKDKQLEPLAMLRRGCLLTSSFTSHLARSKLCPPASVRSKTCVLPQRGEHCRVDEPLLSSEEEQTLRRIASGGLYVSVLREQDVKRLLSLKLIDRDAAKVYFVEFGRRRVFSGGL